MKTETNDFEKLAGMINDIKFTMLTTTAEDGSLHSRPMGTLNLGPKEFDGTLWFFSKRDSIKNHNIEKEPEVNLAYANPDKHQYVSVSGKAFISTDKNKMKDLWNPLLKAWFPEGLEDSEITLIGVNVESAELWDAPPGKVVQLLGFVKSAVTGKPYDNQKHSSHIDLRQ
ncbi:MAG: pyridoxamine 5'-phosphate oxidase family protein [Bacteriovoracia bacterium]